MSKEQKPKAGDLLAYRGMFIKFTRGVFCFHPTEGNAKWFELADQDGLMEAWRRGDMMDMNFIKEMKEVENAGAN